MSAWVLVLFAFLHLKFPPPRPAHPVPIEVETFRFPPYQVCLQEREFLNARLDYLKSKGPLELWQWDAYYDAIVTTENYKRSWQCLIDAEDESCGRHYRRDCLKELRNRLGEQDYWNGKMPLP